MKLFRVFLILYFIGINIFGLYAMKVDKIRAENHEWRISEKNLFKIAIIGAAGGEWAGMYLFRHKTLHNQFIYGMPAIFVLNIAVFILLVNMKEKRKF
jgi:uncharacterized membrane protein YsdA (DUF1294 family)